MGGRARDAERKRGAQGRGWQEGAEVASERIKGPVVLKNSHKWEQMFLEGRVGQGGRMNDPKQM